ncbi:MAG: hypothetical protein J3Q66DRAFT_333899 [Benniella sp.]|nr:MAG: hypothetical protein J3Q66DRAFT_333899 [Benniella sp.]
MNTNTMPPPQYNPRGSSSQKVSSSLGSNNSNRPLVCKAKGPIIELTRPVVVDRAVVPKLFGFMEGRLQAANQEVQCLKQLNQSLKKEVATLNEQAFCEGFEDESEGESEQAAAAAVVTGGGDEGVGGVGGGVGVGGSKSGSVDGGGTGDNTTAAEKKKTMERPFRKCRLKHHPYYTSSSGRKGKNSISSASKKKTHRSKGSKERKEAADSPRKKLRIRVMHQDGPAFQVMVEQRMLETYPEMEIYPDAPKVVFKEGLLQPVHHPK